MNVSEVSSSLGWEPLRVQTDRLCRCFDVARPTKGAAPSSSSLCCPHMGPVANANGGTKHITGLFLNNNTLLFPSTTAQMIINSSLPGHRLGKWWSRCLEWRSHRAELFNTCQHIIVSTIRIKVYRVIHIKRTCREATIRLNERQASDNCFFYYSDTATRFTYGTRFASIVVAAGLRDHRNKTTVEEQKSLLQSTATGIVSREKPLRLKRSLVCLRGPALRGRIFCFCPRWFLLLLTWTTSG